MRPAEELTKRAFDIDRTGLIYHYLSFEVEMINVVWILHWMWLVPGASGSAGEGDLAPPCRRDLGKSHFEAGVQLFPDRIRLPAKRLALILRKPRSLH